MDIQQKVITIKATMMLPMAVKLVAAIVAFGPLSRPVSAAVTLSSIVECSELLDDTGTTFQACATTYTEIPSPAFAGNETITVGQTVYEYNIVEGLSPGVDVNSISEEELTSAKSKKIVISVLVEQDNTCTVTVSVLGTPELCLACSPCGDETFTVECSNVVNGRDVDCESTALGNVYFPLSADALGDDSDSASSNPEESSAVPTSVLPSTTARPSPTGGAPVPTPILVGGPSSVLSPNQPVVPSAVTGGVGGKMTQRGMIGKKNRGSGRMMRMMARGNRGRNKNRKRMSRSGSE